MSDEHKETALVIERRDDRSVSPVVAIGLRMLEQNPNPETLRELLAMQREYAADEARKAYAAALVGLKRDLPSVIDKDKVVSFESRGGKTTYQQATLAHVLDEVTGALTQHGFTLDWTPATRDGRVFVTCTLTHSAGHFREATLDAPIDNTGGKSVVQGVGSTITFLERYTALAVLGIATRDMPEPEGNAAKPDDAARIDPDRNLNAVTALRKRGRTVEAAIAFIGRPVGEWTVADLERLNAWSKPAPPPLSEPPPAE